MSLTARTQTTIVETEDGDTMICYPVRQTKYFLKTIYRVQELEALLGNSRAQLRVCDSSGRYKNLIIKDLEKLVTNKNDEIALQNYEIGQLNSCIKSKDKDIRRQKLYKVGIAILGAVGMSVEGYFLIRR